MTYLTKLLSDVCITSQAVDNTSKLTSFPTITSRSNPVVLLKYDNMSSIVLYC